MSLIPSIEVLREHVPVAYGAGASSLPDVATAEERHLLPALGSALYAELVEQYEAEALTPAMEKVLTRSRAVVGPLAVAYALPLMQTKLTDVGLQQLLPENTRGAYRWEYEAALAALEDRGYSALEALLVFLRSHRADYPDFASAPYNDAAQFPVIRDGADLRGVTNLQQPHRVYLAIKPILLTIDRLYFRPLLGAAFGAVLYAQVVSDILMPAEKELIDLLRMAAGRLAMFHAAGEMHVRFGVSGFTVVSSPRESPEEGRAGARDSQLARFAAEMERSGLALLSQARTHLNRLASVSVFPLYFSSDLYQDPATSSADYGDNASRTGLFVL